MKNFLLTLTMLGALQVGAQVAMIELNDIPGNTPVCVTNYGPYIASVNSAAQAGVTSVWVVATNAVTKQTTLTFNGQPWKLSSNGVFSAATVAQGAKADTALQPSATNGLASVASLYTLMATSQVTKVWEGTNAWYEFASNVVTRYAFVQSMHWMFETTHELVPFSYPLYYIDTETWNIGMFDGDAVVTYKPLSAYNTVNPYATAIPFTAEAFTTNLIYGVVVSTNTTTYYLQTNLTPSETWSRTDMDSWLSTNLYVSASVNTYLTNWMADGNAGQLWATGLADDSAMSAMNAHTGNPDPHPQYPLAQGGTLTNATLAGTVNGYAYLPIIAGTTNSLPADANKTNGVIYLVYP